MFLLLPLALAAPPPFTLEPSPAARGTTGYHAFGFEVAPAGDVDGDGAADLVVAGLARYGGAGVTVLYGGEGGWSGRRDEALVGRAYSQCCYAVSAGDVDGDGLVDLVAGNLSDLSRTGWSGALVLRGTGSGFSAEPDWILPDPYDPEVRSWFGQRIAVLPDMDGDGDDEIAVAMTTYGGTQPGEVHLFWGDPAGPAAAADIVIRAPDEHGWFGASIAAAGDVNADGVGDFVVGNTDPVNGAEGTAYVYLGGPAPTLHATLYLGGSSFEYATVVAGAGDVDGDGYDDVLVNDPRDCARDQHAARFYVFFGGETMGAESFQVEGCPDGSCMYFADVVDGAGDVNGDGYADVVVGSAEFGSPHAWLYPGTPEGVDGENRLRMVPPSVPSSYGNVVRGPGDVDGDGRADVVVGDYADDAGMLNVWIQGDGVVDTGVTSTDPGDDTGPDTSPTGDDTGPDGTIDTAGPPREEEEEETEGKAAECGCAAGVQAGPAGTAVPLLALLALLRRRRSGG